MSFNPAGNEHNTYQPSLPYPSYHHQPMTNGFPGLLNNSFDPGPTRNPLPDSVRQARHSLSTFNLTQDQAFFLPQSQHQSLEAFDSNFGTSPFLSISNAAQEAGGQLHWQLEQLDRSGMGTAGSITQNQHPGSTFEGLFANNVAEEPQFQPEADNQAGNEWPVFGLVPEGTAGTQASSSGSEASPAIPAWWVRRTGHHRLSLTAVVSPSTAHHPLDSSQSRNNLPNHSAQIFASSPNSSSLDSIQYPFQQANQGYQAYQNFDHSSFLVPPSPADSFLAATQPNPHSDFNNSPNSDFMPFTRNNNDDSLQQGHDFPDHRTSFAQIQASPLPSIPLNQNHSPPPLPTPTMPPSRKRTTTATTNKRSYVSNEEQDQRKRLCVKLEGDDDPSFGSGSQRSHHEIIDLVDAEDIPEEIIKEKEKEKNLTKLANFQCVICMDDCTDLVVTSCGHLFCGPCIHESLHTSAAKTLCPMCRQNIIPRSHAAKNRGRFHLNIKKRGKLEQGRVSKKRRAP